MRFDRVYPALTLAGLAALAACGTRPIGSGRGVGAGSTAPFTLAISAPFTLGTQNNQPTGVTVLSFRISLTGAVLQPGNVSLISSPQTIELTQLQTDNFLIGTTNIRTANYDSLELTFANPDMTIFSGPGSVANCTLNTICEIQPTLTVSSLTLSPALTLTANTPAALELELSVNDSLQQNLSFDLNAGLTFEELPSVTSDETSFSLNTVAGQITAVGSNQFMLSTTAGQNLTTATTSSTSYSFPSMVCTKNDFSCLAIGQVVSVDINVLGDGTLQANAVVFEDNSGDPAILGTISALDTTASPPQFTLIIHGQTPATNGITTDNVATVALESSTKYVIDPDDLTVPSGFTFASTADLVVGQEVLVRGNTIDVTPMTNKPSKIAITTNQLVLRQSQWTASVGLPNTGTGAFSLTSLPSLFSNLSPNPISNLYVESSTPTAFVNVSPTGLTAGTPVTIKGLIFSNTSNAVEAPSDVASIVEGAPNFEQQP